MPNIFDLFNWDTECRYRIIGVKRQNNDESIILFYLEDTEMLIPNATIVAAEEDTDIPKPSFDDDIKPIGTRGSILAYPEEWIHTFGSDYYRQAQANELQTYNETGKWNTQSEGTPFNLDEVPLQVTSIQEIEETLENIINNQNQEETNE